MFIKSAANDMEQGRAIHKANERWGCDYRKWQGRETIGIPVCKKKYAPFEFKKVFNNGKVRIEVKRMYGCACHSNLRERVIRKAQERKGWEPFGQWSLKKAKSLANRLADRLNRTNDSDSNSSSSDSDEGGTGTALDDIKLCHNGMCVWRYKHKYDDIMEEIETCN